MKTFSALVAIFALLALGACSSAGDGTFPSPAGSGTTSGGSGSSSGASSGAGTGSSGGAGSGGGVDGSAPGDGGVSYPDVEAGTSFGPDAQAILPSMVDQTITLTGTPVTVPAGQEVFKCQIFANPFSGKNVDIIQLDGTMSRGSHHFFLFNMDPTTLALRGVVGGAQPMQDCAGKGLEFHPFPYLSQQPHFIVQFPDPATGAPMGYPLVGTNSLMINIHFVNTGSTDYTASASITLKTAKPGVVTTHVGTIFLNMVSLSVTPTPQTAPQWYSSTWSPGSSLPSKYTIFASISHMHKWSVDFKATVGSSTTPFYEEPGWDSPQLIPQKPPLQMTNSQSITWACNYYNDTGATLSFGDHANTNVMCIYMGQYFPADQTAPDIIVAAN